MSDISAGVARTAGSGWSSLSSKVVSLHDGSGVPEVENKFLHLLRPRPGTSTILHPLHLIGQSKLWNQPISKGQRGNSGLEKQHRYTEMGRVVSGHIHQS